MPADDNEAVGYRRPPKRTQWKKGQSGNPGKVRSKSPKKLWQIIESVLATEVAISENGKQRSGTVYEGIVLQLWMKAVSGSRPAFRVFRSYEAFSKTLPDFYVRKKEDEAKLAEMYERSFEP